jgi:hypothetical protein
MSIWGVKRHSWDFSCDSVNAPLSLTDQTNQKKKISKEIDEIFKFPRISYQKREYDSRNNIIPR